MRAPEKLAHPSLPARGRRFPHASDLPYHCGMLFPIRTDRPLRTTPAVNYALIATNVVVFLLTASSVEKASMMVGEVFSWSVVAEHFPVVNYYLHTAEPRLEQFITSAFLHADLWHLLGNMVFLFVFGNSLEDRLGKVGYLFFYLAGAVLAGLAHVAAESAAAENPLIGGVMLGASGAVCSVTGAYMALFPMSRVTLLIFAIIVGFIDVPSLWFVLFFFVQDAVQYATRAGSVAYLAHIGGTIYGFLLGMSLLWLRFLPREPYDLLSMLEHRRRRAEFRRLARQGYKAWEHLPDTGPGKGKSPILDQGAKPSRVSPNEQRLMDKRVEVTRAVSASNWDRAAELYAELLDLDGGQVLSQQQQSDLANQLAHMGRHELAARAYELLLNTFKTLADREQIELILAVIYVRYLARGQRARELITAALPRLRTPEQKSLATAMLAELEKR